MFGFSLTKLLFTAAVILAVWYGFKWVGRMQVKRNADAKEKLRAERGRASVRPRPSPAAAMDAEDMVKCPACGDYVAARSMTHCGRDDCPYPG